MRTETHGGAVAVGRLLVAAGLLLLGACRQDMHDQAKFEPLEKNPFFADGMASRKPPAHTVARGFLRQDSEFYTGLDAAGIPAAGFPLVALRERLPNGAELEDRELRTVLLVRGRQRYGMFCTPCHDQVGTGNGMIVQRGFKRPPSLHEERLRKSLPGYFVNVMSEGFGQMSSYAHQITPEDRWAIAAYIGALQLSQNARLAELPLPLRQEFDRAMENAAGTGAGELPRGQEHGGPGGGQAGEVHQ